MAEGTRDSEGAFALVNLFPTAPGPLTGATRPPKGEASRPMGGRGFCSPAMAEGTGDPEGAFTSFDLVPAAPGPLKAVAALETVVSAMMFGSPVMWRIEGANSATRERCHCWRAETGSDRLCRAPTRGLWSVKTPSPPYLEGDICPPLSEGSIGSNRHRAARSHPSSVPCGAGCSIGWKSNE